VNVVVSIPSIAGIITLRVSNMTNEDKSVNNKIDSCICNAVNIIEDLTEFYIAAGMIEQKSYKAKENYYASAKRLTEKITNQIANKPAFDTKIPDIYSEKLRDAKKYLTSCKDGIKSDCIFSLEMMRQVLHESPHAREKFLCNPVPIVRPNISRSKIIRAEMRGDIISKSELSGELYGRSSKIGDGIQSLLQSIHEATFISEGILRGDKFIDESYHPFKRYIPEEYIEKCKEHKAPITKFTDYINR
jgi:hypothetical protein